MAITFFASRTLARNAAKELNNGKVKDMGSTAPAGERWAVEYTSKSDAIANVAAAHGLEVHNIPADDVNAIENLINHLPDTAAVLEIVNISANSPTRPARELLAERRDSVCEPSLQDLTVLDEIVCGKPGTGKSVLIFDDISDCISTDKLQELVKEANEIKRSSVDMSNMYGKPTIMRTRKTNSPVEVRVKRNKGKLFNAALMEALSRVN